MIALVSTRPSERITAYPFIVDLQEVSGTVKGQEATRVWEDDAGRLAGFNLLEDSFLSFDISRDADFDVLASQMIGWAMGLFSIRQGTICTAGSDGHKLPGRRCSAGFFFEAARVYDPPNFWRRRSGGTGCTSPGSARHPRTDG
jgi:hypothetical protein